MPKNPWFYIMSQNKPQVNCGIKKSNWKLYKFGNTTRRIRKPRNQLREARKQIKEILNQSTTNHVIDEVKILSENKVETQQKAQEKVVNLFTKTITSQVLDMNEKDQKQMKEQELEQSKKIQQVKSKEYHVLKDIQKLQSLAAKQCPQKNREIAKMIFKLKQMKENFEKKKQDIKSKCKAKVEKTALSTEIKCSDFNIDLFKAKIHKRFRASRDIIDIHINEKPISLRGGDQGDIRVEYQIDESSLKQKLKKFAESIAKMMNVSNKAGEIYNDAVKDLVFKLGLLENQCKQTKKRMQDQKTKEDLRQKLRQNSAFTIQLVFVIDTTGSAFSTIKKTKQLIKDIIKKYQAQYPKSIVRVGIVSFKDHIPNETQLRKMIQEREKDPNQTEEQEKEEEEFLLKGALEQIKPFSVTQSEPLTTDMNKVINFLSGLRTGGGFDTPEAVYDGLMNVKKMDWTKNSFKNVFIITDAPPHGSQYHEGMFDIFPGGCEHFELCGITIDQISQYYKSNKINLNYKECGSYTYPRVHRIFKQKFGDLYSHGIVSEESFKEQINKELEKKINDEFTEKETKIAQEFKEVCFKIVQKIKQEVEKMIQTVQSLKEISRIEAEIQNLDDQKSNIDLALRFLTGNETSPLKSIEQIQKKLNESLSTKSKLEQVQKIIDAKIMERDKQAVRNLRKAFGADEQSLVPILAESYPHIPTDYLILIIRKCLQQA